MGSATATSDLSPRPFEFCQGRQLSRTTSTQQYSLRNVGQSILPLLHREIKRHPRGFPCPGSARSSCQPCPALSEPSITQGPAPSCQHVHGCHRHSAPASSFQPPSICIHLTPLVCVCTANSSLELTSRQFIVDSTLLPCAQSCSAVSSKKQEDTCC